MAQVLADISHVIFDLDGLLIDTETRMTIASNTIVNRFGKQFTVEIKRKVMGKTPMESAKIILKELDLPMELEDYMEQFNEQVAIQVANADFMPGAERLVKHLRNNRIPMAIATGSDQVQFALKTKKFGDFFEKHFDHVVCAGDPEVKRGKPWSDVFLVCLQRFQSPAETFKVLVFEDAPNGVMAATSCGMNCVMVPDRSVNDPHKDATLVLDSLEHFKPELFNLPPF